MLDYTPEEFVEDLIEVLSSNKSSGQEADLCNIQIFDEKLKREVHLYELVILCSHGLAMPSLSRLLTDEQALELPYDLLQPLENINYDIFVSMTSLITGDYEYLQNYGRNFMNLLNIKEAEKKQTMKALLKCLMLIKGSTPYLETNDISGLKHQYDEMFKALFGNQKERAKTLHKIATIKEDDILAVLISKYSVSDDEKTLADLTTRTELIDDFLHSCLHFDTESIEWVVSLSRVALGDVGGFDFIAKQYDLPVPSQSICKAILTKDYKKMEPLFQAIREHIPPVISRAIARLLEGDITKVLDLVKDW